LLFFSRSIKKYFKKKRRGVSIPYKNLDETEKRILQDISVGKSYHFIAGELNISKEEVQKCIRNIYEKLQNEKSN
jgi:DNA-binding NarL/FixJ family response regulator